MGDSDRVVTEKRYDANGNVLALVLFNRVGGTDRPQVTTYAYDEFDRQTLETLPSVGDNQARTTSTVYDRAGEPLAVTDAKNQVVESDYDRAGRVSATRFKTSTVSVEETRASTYDKVGNLLSRTDKNGTSSYVYDDLNRIVSESRNTTATGIADSYTVVSAYDPAGNRTNVVYPGGRTLVSSFDAAGRMTQMADGTNVTSFLYDAAGNRTREVQANGVEETAEFDAANRITHIEAVNSADATIYDLNYKYDLAGQRRFASEMLVGQSSARNISWNYDGVYRLISESWTGPQAQTRAYTYDPAGNRLSRTLTPPGGQATTTSYVYDDLNRLNSIDNGATTYSYDLNGNRISKAVGNITTDYIYDTSDRLIGATSGNSTIFSAAYDARTRRLDKTESGTTLYRYDGGTNFQELQNGVVNTELIRAGGLGGGIGSVLYTDKSMASGPGPVEFFVYDALGNTVALTNVVGTATQTNLYEAFGETLTQAGTSTNNRLHNTKERDASIGLDNHGFRYYDADASVYVQRDPIGYGDGLNVYASVGNNPINDIDPLGLERSFWGKVLGTFLSDDTIYDLGLDSETHPIDPAVIPVTSRITGGVQMVAGGIGATVFTAAALSPDPEPASHVVAGVAALKSAEIASNGFDMLLHGAAASGVPTVGQVVTATANAVGVPPVTSQELGSTADYAGNLTLATSFVAAIGSEFSLRSTSTKARPVVFRVPEGATAADVAQMQAYCNVSNAALDAGALSSTGRVSTVGALREAASAARNAEGRRAAAAGTPYTGHVGHVPDTTWTNNPQPYSWMDLSPKVNTSLGSQARKYPIGYKPTEFMIEESK